MVFDAAPEFASGQKMQNNITYDKSSTDTETARKIRDFISNNSSVPMLIFLENVNDEKLISGIRAACTEVRLNLGTCFNEEQLATFGKDAGGKSKGVYLFPKKFGRGIDFKLQIDAKVLILMNGEHKLTTADINQLAGRGNRSQAIPSALLIMINSTYEVDAMAIIQRNDDVGEVNQVPDNVKRLYDRWRSLAKDKPDKRASIA